MIIVLIVSIVAALLVGFFVGTRLAAARRRSLRAGVQTMEAGLLAEARAEMRTTTVRLAELEKALDAAEAQLVAEGHRGDDTGPPDPTPIPDGDGTPAADPTPAPDDPGDVRNRSIVDAVWQLQRLELDWQRRREAQLSTAVDETAGPIGLAHALRQEIERVREEIGTPGDFSTDLMIEPEPAVALLVLRSTQSTLDVLARQSQAFDLHLGGDGTGLTVTVRCEDFEGSSPDAELIAEAIVGAGGTLSLDQEPDGSLMARLSVSTLSLSTS